jgi:hypothetical protein
MQIIGILPHLLLCTQIEENLVQINRFLLEIVQPLLFILF